jgi:hypothetical protein
MRVEAAVSVETASITSAWLIAAASVITGTVGVTGCGAGWHPIKAHRITLPIATFQLR